MATTPRPRGPRRHPFPGRRCPPAPGGRGLLPLPTLPPFPALTPRPLWCPLASQVPDTHVSRGSSGSSPARCSPTHSRSKEPSRIRVARGPAGRNTWGLCARNRKRPLAPPPGGAEACLGCRRFGPLVVFLISLLNLFPFLDSGCLCICVWTCAGDLRGQRYRGSLELPELQAVVNHPTLVVIIQLRLSEQ